MGGYVLYDRRHKPISTIEKDNHIYGYAVGI